MREFYTWYYLGLFLFHASLPLLFRLWAALTEKKNSPPPSRVVHYKKELRGHLTVCILLSAMMLSFVPLPISGMNDAKNNGDMVINGVFVLIFIATAGFFLWLGGMQATANRRALAEAKADEQNQQ